MVDQATLRTRYVYHRVPEPLRGTTLYPLNHLRAHFPDIAASQDLKYVGREALRTRRIPYLDCLWNDVLMLLPVHPTKVWAALAAAGFTRFPPRWFAVDVALLPVLARCLTPQPQPQAAALT